MVKDLRQLTGALFIGIIIFSLSASPAFCGNNGKGKGNAGKSNTVKVNNGKSAQQKINNGKSAQQKVHDRKQAKQNSSQRVNRPDRKVNAQNASPGAAIKEEKLAKLTHRRRHERPTNQAKEKVQRVQGVLKALENARWAYNPHDERGQGNNGKPTMLDPFGFDKDSDRKELYGNNGRPIREKDDKEKPAGEDVAIVEEDPVIEEVAVEEGDVVEASIPVEENVAEEVVVPTPDDILVAEAASLGATIDFSSIDSMEWLLNWYESTIANYYNNESVQERYTYEEWDTLWYDHFFPGGDLTSTTGIRLNNIGDTSDRYNYDIALNNFEGESVEVTTQMVLAEDYTSTRYYDEATGSWVYESTEYKAGDVVYEDIGEVSVDSTTGGINVGITATDDMIGYSSDEVYIDMVVTVTDPVTGSTYTQSYDKALYLYRCPYGKVYNSVTNRPIINAKVSVHFEDGSVVALDRASNPTASNPQTTDVTGRYGFKLETNRKYYMTASADGYEDYKSPVFTEKWHVLREDVALNPIMGSVQ